MSKRIIALLLCMAVASTVFSCGDDALTGTDTTASGGEATVADDGQLKSGVPADKDFGGETVTILNGYYMDYQTEYLDIPETTGDLLDDAIYERNVAVMDNLNVKLKIDNFDIWNDYANVRSSVFAGDDEWDFLMGMQYRITQLAPEGVFLDIKDAPYIDITNPWWSTQFIENLNIGDKHRYLLSGDYSIGHLNQSSAMFYNKKVYKDYFGNADEMYDLVLDGKWTLDKMNEIVSKVSRDLNGDTKIEWENDQFGTALRMTAFTSYHICYDAGASLTVFENGKYSLDGMTDKNVSIVEKVIDLTTNNAGFVKVPAMGDEFEMAFSNTFAEDRVLIMPGLLSYADYLRDMESDYGVIPYPTLEEGMDYRALVHNQAMTLAVPITNTKKLDVTAAVMEEMAYLGWRDMVPTYYEIVLKQKYMRDDQDKAMQIMDIIHDSTWTELAFTYGSFVNLYARIFKDPIEGIGNFASNYEQYITAADQKLEELVAFFDK